MKDWARFVSVALGAIGVVVVACCVFHLMPLGGPMARVATELMTDGDLVAAAALALVGSVLVVEVGRRRRAVREPSG